VFFQLCPENAENYVDYLLTVDQLDEAAVLLIKLVNNENFVSKKVFFCPQIAVNLYWPTFIPRSL